MPFVFGDHRLDAKRRELRRGDQVVEVEPQVFDLLFYLLQNRERVVSKDDLIAVVWGGRIVSDATVDSRIKSARQAVGDSGSAQALIRTFPRKGIRFVGAAEEQDDTAPVEKLSARVPRRPEPALPEKPAVATLPEQPSPAAPSFIAVAGDAERRQLTVMACSLVGSIPFSSHLDPEDLYARIGVYHRRVAEVIGRFGGHVAKSMDDGMLIYFGYPQAQEDDAERAVHAGLALVKAAGGLAGQPSARLDLRVGIATGLVVVGDLAGSAASMERDVVGETPILAARLQELASPGSVVISAGTRRLAGGVFEYRGLGIVALKGFVEKVEAWRVLGASAAESRFEALHESGLSSLVGRAAELELLLSRWRQIVEGDGRVVLLTGEPGIGKSRLTRALQERLAHEPHLRVRFYCSPYHRDSALYPISSHLERAAGFERDDTAEERLGKLEKLLALASAGPEQVGLIVELLGLPLQGRYQLPEISPQQRKEKIFETLLAQAIGLAARQPVLMLFEDAHWIDPTSLELLTAMIERVQRDRVLVLITARPEFVPPWSRQDHLTTLSLSRLSRREGTALIEQLTNGKALPDEILGQILARTDGVPLFVEELTKTIVESGVLRDAGDHYAMAAPLSPTAIPATLHDSLMARLDRLTVRDVAQTAACVGRDFARALLAAVSGLTQERLGEALDELRRAGLIVAAGVGANERYSFRHALIRDAAYESLLKGRRAQLHAVIAAVLEQSFADLVAAQPEIVAHHFSEAGEPDKAIAYWARAGQVASLRSAHAEAFSHLNRGLELLNQVPDARTRDRRELSLRTVSGAVYVATKGYSAAETVATYKRATDLLQANGDTRTRLAVHNGLLVGYYNLAQFDSGLELAEDTLERGERDGNGAVICVGHRMMAAVCNSIGEFERAADHARRGWELYRPERDGLAALGLVHDTGLGAKLHLALALSQLGFQDQAKQVAAEALSLAAQLGHANSQAYAWFFGGVLVNFVCHDPVALTEYAPRLRAYAQQHGMPQWAAYGRAFGAAVPLASPGDARVAVEEITAAISDCERIQNSVFRPAHLTILASAELAAGRADQALAATASAFEIAARTREHWFTAETWRVRGHVLLSTGRWDSAEESFRRAIAISQTQAARLFELRATAALARLWRDDGRRSEALSLLAAIYGWFTEGFDTPDLTEAKGLLEELA